MDILAHSLWTNVLFKVIPQTRQDRRTTWWGIFFGVFPDLLAFTPVFVLTFYNAIFRHTGLPFARPEDTNGGFPLDVLTGNLYNLSHSLVVWGFVFALAWVIFRKIPWVLFGWALHVSIDIFSHNSQFFPTPFLWPVSKFHVDGWSWGTPIFMAVNYGLILLVYTLLIPYIKRKYIKPKPI